MFNHDFYQPVSIEEAPPAHSCEWCGDPAVYRLTALGGARHNEAGFFCRECGEAFCNLAHKSAKTGRYVSEEEIGEDMRQILTAICLEDPEKLFE